MIEIDDLSGWRDAASAARASGRRVGLVPTMGALHAGHRRLIETATAAGDWVLVTIFVNPRQFDDPEDLARYPRDLGADRLTASAAGADCLVIPRTRDMWPDGPENTSTTVHVAGLGDLYEGAQRPGHFDGVASVVAKLFAITGPCRAYFGEKDYQQMTLVRAMARDLGFDVDVVSVPIVRDEDGLALSSRNVLLSAEGRRRALHLPAALADVAAEPACASQMRERVRSRLADAGLEVAYVEVVDPVTLTALDDHAEGEARVLGAIVVDGVRLIDNVAVHVKGGA